MRKKAKRMGREEEEKNLKKRGVGYEGQGKSRERRRLSAAVGEIGKLLDKNREIFFDGMWLLVFL